MSQLIVDVAPPQDSCRDWDDAYRNAPYIKNGDNYAAGWTRAAADFRQAWPAKGGGLELDCPYGPQEREKLDLFMPAATPLGLVVFVHGGYWRAFDRTLWSHLAAGALAHRFAVAMPSYTLCPETRIAAIGIQVARAIEYAAGRIPGPIGLAGHSAGGQLVARMLTTTSPLAPSVASRVCKVVAISGVHDLRPLQHIELNQTLRIDDEEAAAESPVLLRPRAGLDITAWVGGDERPEFIRQNAALATVWGGFDCAIWPVVEAARHHFDVIAGLADPDCMLTRTLVDPLLARGQRSSSSGLSRGPSSHRF